MVRTASTSGTKRVCIPPRLLVTSSAFAALRPLCQTSLLIFTEAAEHLLFLPFPEWQVKIVSFLSIKNRTPLLLHLNYVAVMFVLFGNNQQTDLKNILEGRNQYYFLN